MLHQMSHLLAHYGYLAVAAFMIAEGCGIPLPAETMLVTAAAYASRGQLSVWGVIVVSTLGGIVGGSAGYLIGAWGGLPFLHRYGRRLRIDEAKLERAQSFFRERGGSAAFLGRFAAFLRMIVPMLAGVARMSFGRFSGYNAAGAFVASLVYAFLGYQFGRDLPTLEHHLTLVTAAAVVLLLVVVIVVRGRSERRVSAAPSSRDSA